MNWEAVGAVGEIVGAFAVVLTLGLLLIQLRRSTQAMSEANRLNRAAALDRHSESIGRWRSRLAEHEDLARLWFEASRDGELTEIELLRVHNLWIDFVNTQRSNYVRAVTVGDTGLTRQSVLSVALEAHESRTFRDMWQNIRGWTELACPEYVSAVDTELTRVEREGNRNYVNRPTSLFEQMRRKTGVE